MKIIPKKKIIQYYKRFADGEQFIEINKITHKITTIDKVYFWQEQRVYNHIKPLLNIYGKQFTEEELYGRNGLVSMLEPYQRTYNEIMNQQSQYIKMATEGYLSVEDGSIDVNDLCEEGLSGGKILVYRQGSVEPELHTTEVKTDGYIKTCEFCLNRMYQIISNYVESKKQKEK